VRNFIARLESLSAACKWWSEFFLILAEIAFWGMVTWMLGKALVLWIPFTWVLIVSSLKGH
jgi:hypothetical protein